MPFSLLYLPAWFANILLLTSMALLLGKAYRAVLITSSICVALALSAFLVAKMDGHWLVLQTGYFVWAGAIILFHSGAVLCSSLQTEIAARCWAFTVLIAAGVVLGNSAGLSDRSRSDFAQMEQARQGAPAGV